MKKIILSYYIECNCYTLKDDFLTNHSELYFLHMALNPFEDSWINCEKVSLENKVYIYSDDSFKKQADIDFQTLQQAISFEKEYNIYYEKRWQEIPKIEISIQDWDLLQKKWNQIKKEKPNYVIFTLDDSGPLDKVDIIGKQELSEQDIAYIKQEHEKYLKYKKAREQYIDNHPDYSDVWRGPQDDEYEADIMKYYEEDES